MGKVSSLRCRRSVPSLRLAGAGEAWRLVAASRVGRELSAAPSPLETVYRSEAVLDSGTFSTVHFAERRSDGEMVALKQIRCDSDSETRRAAEEEYAIMSSISHSAIVRASAWHETESSAWICMEYCNLGSVTKYVKFRGTIDVTDARSLAHQLLSAVNHLHQKRYVHRDVKPENALLSDDAGELRLKLADFNSAKRIGDHAGATAMLSVRGTRLYAAPEIHSGTWSERVDIWGCGLCVFVMLAGRLPFIPGSDESQRLLTLGLVPPMDFAQAPGFMGNLVRQCLEPDPWSRPPAMELLAHPVFQRSPRKFSGGSPQRRREPHHVGFQMPEGPDCSSAHTSAGSSPSRLGRARLETRWRLRLPDRLPERLDPTASAPVCALGPGAACSRRAWRRQSWPPDVDPGWQTALEVQAKDDDLDSEASEDESLVSCGMSATSSPSASPSPKRTLEVLAARRFARMTA